MTSSHFETHYPLPADPPPTSFLTGTWNVIYSTLPMWKDRRNVRITYTALPPSDPTVDSPVPRLDDLVTYQTLTSDKNMTIQGIDTPSGGDTIAWDWRGKGWLNIVTSHWEFIDWANGPNEEDQWAVLWFQKTIFTPERVDIISRSKDGVGENMLRMLILELKGRDKCKAAMYSGLFMVKCDGMAPTRLGAGPIY